LTYAEIEPALKQLTRTRQWKAFVHLLRIDDARHVDSIRSDSDDKTAALSLAHNERIRSLVVSAAFKIGETNPFSDSHLQEI
jgi:hypothetical protein